MGHAANKLSVLNPYLLTRHIMKDRSKREAKKAAIRAAFRQSILEDLNIAARSDGMAVDNEDYDSAVHVMVIEQLMLDIVGSEDVLFFARSKGIIKFIPTKLGKRVLHNIKRSFSGIHRTFPQHRFNPYVEVFIRQVERFIRQLENSRLKDLLWEERLFRDEEWAAMKRVDLLNDFIVGLRTEAKSPQFDKAKSSYGRVRHQNEKSLRKYIEALFDHKRARLRVLRVDLLYKKDHPEDYFQAKEDLEHFLNNWRSNKLFDDLDGYAWRLEYAPQTGFHYHLLFFFDGSAVNGDVIKARKIGEYWETTVTQGRG
jgi:hypothetical protein